MLGRDGSNTVSTMVLDGQAKSGRLLRVSRFCRPRNSLPARTVRVKWLERSTVDNQQQSLQAAFVSISVLLDLSAKTNDVALLSIEGTASKPAHAVPVVLKVIPDGFHNNNNRPPQGSHDQTAKESNEVGKKNGIQPGNAPFKVTENDDDDDDNDDAIFVAPTLIGMVHSWYSGIQKNDSDSDQYENDCLRATLRLYSMPLGGSIPMAGQVLVRLLGRPVPTEDTITPEYSNFINKNDATNSNGFRKGGRNDDSGQDTQQMLAEVPRIAGRYRPAFVSRGSLVSVWHKNTVFVYEVTDIIGLGQWHTVAATAESTTWDLVNDVERAIPCSRLPQLHRCASFFQARRFDPPPHPNIRQVIDALQISTGKSNAGDRRILHVVGTVPHHHVDVCVCAASDRIGMRYLPVRGLAAYAHRYGHKVSTGGIADQIEGCKVALQNAQRSTPCVLHLVDLDQEWAAYKADVEALHAQQQRLWTLLVSFLDDRTDVQHDEGSYPDLLVVFSTMEPLKDNGPFQQNAVWQPVLLDRPDPEYNRYLLRLHGGPNNTINDKSASIGIPANKVVQQSMLASKATDWASMESTSSPQLPNSSSSFRTTTDASKSSNTSIPNVHWEDVGGLQQVRDEIRDALELPMEHPELFTSGGRSGLLLYGPPGTGKTLVAKAVATEYGLPFFSVKGPELLDSYIGESEANVRKAFAEASLSSSSSSSSSSDASPTQAFCSVLFFDELDSLAPRRSDSAGSGGAGVMDRVVATLLTELDRNNNKSTHNHDHDEEKHDKRIGKNRGKAAPVFVMGATNRPDLLDPALFRSGRLDRLVYLGLPTSSSDRAQILAALIRKFRLEGGTPLQVATQVIDRFPPRLSGADMASIATDALMRSIRRLCNEIETECTQRQQITPETTIEDVLDDYSRDGGQRGAHDHSGGSIDRVTPIVTLKDLLEAAASCTPSVRESELKRYEQLRQEFSTTTKTP